MAKQLAEVEIHAAETADDDENLDISVDLIDDGLYLGNLACARDHKMLERLKVTHVLTIDLVPLPRTVLDCSKLIFKFVKLADIPKEDLISQLPDCNEFIKQAIAGGGTVLVHCYFGVSRSAAVVIAYIMEKYGLCFEEAFVLVKSKRRFIGPNVGFVAQLKLFGHMGYLINREDPRYKQFRLKMAGQKLKQVKILPQLFADLIKPDPGLIRERPDPIVYRCKKCRRIVASQSNIIPHIPKQVKIELAKKGIRPPPSKLTGLTCAENGQLLIEKLKSLACQIMDGDECGVTVQDGEEGSSQVLDGYHETNLVESSIAARADLPTVCRLMWFVEPMRWMEDVGQAPQGRLNCPKCRTKLGSFSWLMGTMLGLDRVHYAGQISERMLICPNCRMKLGSFSWIIGCKCPCGQKVAPAFYLVPSKVEWSNIVQNVQVTV